LAYISWIMMLARVVTVVVAMGGVVAVGGVVVGLRGKIQVVVHRPGKAKKRARKTSGGGDGTGDCGEPRKRVVS
jgi:hypothetical protein